MKFYKKIILLIVIISFFICWAIYHKISLNGNKLEKAISIPDDNWEYHYSNVKIKNTYKVVFISHFGGELSYAKYFKYVAENKGWQVKIYSQSIQGDENEIIKFDPDFIIFSEYSSPIKDMRLVSHRSKKYLLVIPPIEVTLKQKLLNKELLPQGNFLNLILDSHGLLTSSKGVYFYKKIFDKFNKKFYGFRLLPIVPNLYPNVPAEPKNLMWVGMQWDKFRSSENYINFIKLLNNNFPIKVYGFYNKFSFLGKSYDGFIPPGIENIKAIRKNGIYLLTHSDLHIKEGNPSLRLFEAAAANVVIISDRNPFTIEHFGDSVLYFDQNADSETMYKQVKNHLEWIYKYPEKAKQLANRCNKIFAKKFNLENDLIRIAQMHEEVLLSEKNQGLSYNIVY